MRCSGLPGPSWCPAPSGGRGGGPAKLGAGGGDLGSLLLRTLSTGALLLGGLRVLLAEREAAWLSQLLLLAVLGSVVLGVSLFFR